MEPDDYKLMMEEIRNKKQKEIISYFEKLESYKKIIERDVLCYNTKSNSLHLILENISPAYLEPIYHLNSFLNRDVPHEIIDIISQVEFEATCRSTRILLERIALILRVIYPTTSKKSKKEGLGYYNEKEPSGKGIIKLALELRKSDSFMNNLIYEYDSWIKRNTELDNNSKHNHNLTLVGRLEIGEDGSLPDFAEIFYLDKTIDETVDLDENDKIEPKLVDQNMLINFVNNTYTLLNKTIEYTINKIKAEKAI